MTNKNQSLYDDLRIQIVELHKENRSLRDEIDVLKHSLAEEVKEKYKCYERLAKIT